MVTLHCHLIRNFRSKALEQLFHGNPKGIEGKLRGKVTNVLTLLNAAESLEGVDLPSFRLHLLEGDLGGFWSITVSGNWRIIFRFADGDALDIDFVDYH